LLGEFHLLSLLKGWEYKTHVVSRDVIRGADPLDLLSVSESGWVLLIDVLTYDAYGSLIVDFQGADLQQRSGRIYPEAYRGITACAQDPSGWIQRYFRPNPYSTAGIYYLVGFSGGFQGATLPYVPTVHMRLYLAPESTQVSTYISAGVTVIAITDKVLFIQSLRRLQDAKASLKIDPALLATGPAQFAEAKE